MKRVRRGSERGQTEYDWLHSHHTFSFADYHDPEWMGFFSLRVINDDLVMPGKGFGTHPHRDMEILTYVLSGALAHKDSLGNGRVIRAGELQYMAAGSGIEHSELNPSRDEAVHFLQIWVVPESKGAPPRYEDKSMVLIPKGKPRLIASQTGRDDSIQINQNADIYLTRLDPGSESLHALKPGRNAWLHVAEGILAANGELLQAGDALALADEPVLEMFAESASQALLFDLR